MTVRASVRSAFTLLATLLLAAPALPAFAESPFTIVPAGTPVRMTCAGFPSPVRGTLSIIGGDSLRVLPAHGGAAFTVANGAVLSLDYRSARRPCGAWTCCSASASAWREAQYSERRWAALRAACWGTSSRSVSMRTCGPPFPVRSPGRWASRRRPPGASSPCAYRSGLRTPTGERLDRRERDPRPPGLTLTRAYALLGDSQGV